MYQLLCLLSGVLLAVVITTNGSLTGFYGAYVGTVIVHIVGTAVAYVAMKSVKQSWKPARRIPLWMYSGGAMGILTTVFQGVAFGQLGVTAILALSLFGQTVTALIVDGCGLFGMERRKVGKGTVIGILVSMCGIVYLLKDAGEMQVYALLMSIASGVSGVLSRLVNARLAAYTTPIGSSFTNHWVGLVGSVILMLVAEPNIIGCLQVTDVPNWVYVGGAVGVAMVLLWNIAGQRVSAFQLTMLSFVGQVFAGIVLDLLVGNGFSQQTFMGGVFVVVGVVLNMLSEQKMKGEIGGSAE